MSRFQGEGEVMNTWSTWGWQCCETILDGKEIVIRGRYAFVKTHGLHSMKREPKVS
jgi:hypothetical protein